MYEIFLKEEIMNIHQLSLKLMHQSFHQSLNIITKATLLLASIIVINQQASASILNLKSDESADVEVSIEPGDGSILPNKEGLKVVLKPGEEKKIEVTKKMFDNDSFSVTGKVKLPSMHNKCGNLLIDKDYKIIFTGSKMGGTICIAETLN